MGDLLDSFLCWMPESTHTDNDIVSNPGCMLYLEGWREGIKAEHPVKKKTGAVRAVQLSRLEW